MRTTLSQDGTVKITDFGVSELCDGLEVKPCTQKTPPKTLYCDIGT